MDWGSWGPEEQLWIPALDILDPNLFKEYYRDHSHGSALYPQGCPALHFEETSRAVPQDIST